jgi:hypothetical protein
LPFPWLLSIELLLLAKKQEIPSTSSGQDRRPALFIDRLNFLAGPQDDELISYSGTSGSKSGVTCATAFVSLA